MPLLDLFWTTLMIFGWILWFMLLFRVYGDLFTRRDVGDWVKTAWVVVTLLLPVLGVLVYLITQGRGMAERQIRAAEQQQRATEAYIRSVAADAESEQRQKAQALLQSGAVTPAEYQQMVASPRA